MSSKKHFTARLDPDVMKLLEDYGGNTDILEQATNCLLIEEPDKEMLILRMQLLRMLPDLVALQSNNKVDSNFKNAVQTIINYADTII